MAEAKKLSLSKGTNLSLLALRDSILTIPPCPERDMMQRKLDEVIDRIQWIPHRLLTLHEAGHLDRAGLDDEYKSELAWAMQPLHGLISW